ncbi:MAG: hypothetical protein ONA69_02815 [candidate division KSB1 bacterium]|nr:hypothetical protein [candidate division KSB1 bacterium]MDZ7345702.1 hypothetical protein [candidate division KSB1 bacterium]
MKTKRLITGILILFVACSRSFSPVEPQAAESEEQAVYRAILNDMGKEGKVIVVIPDSTANFTITASERLSEMLPELQHETLVNFNLANQSSFPLHLPTQTAVRYYLVHQRDIPPIFELKTKFPDASAVVHFSRVGFNSDKTQALVYRATYWGPLAAIGELVLLSKKEGWQVIAEAGLWIS